MISPDMQRLVQQQWQYTFVEDLKVNKSRKKVRKRNIGN